MKISNSKKELARIISENGGWRNGAEWATQDHVVAFFSGGKPKYETYDKTWCANGDDGVFIVAMSVDGKIGGFHNTILSREEYFHLYPAPDADGWIEWKGGECPVDHGVMIDVRYRDGVVSKCMPALEPVADYHDVMHQYWQNDGVDGDIIAYRLHKLEQSKPEFCESVMLTIPEPEAKPTIEQLAADYRNAKDYAERKQKDADDAKADADMALGVLERAGEELGLLVSPIATHNNKVIA